MGRHQCTYAYRRSGVFCPGCGKVWATVTEEFRPDPEAQRKAAERLVAFIDETRVIGESELPSTERVA